MRLVVAITILLLASAAVNAQRIAIIEPQAERIEGLATGIRAELAGGIKTLDESLTHAAFNSVIVADPFNLTTQESRRIGEVLGVGNFIL